MMTRTTKSILRLEHFLQCLGRLRITTAGLAIFVLALLLSGSSLAQSVSPGDQPPKQTLALILDRFGFHRDAVSLPPGKTQILIYNRLGREITYEIVLEGSSLKVKDKRTTPIKQKKLFDVVDLQSGTYRLQIRDNPSWAVRISVTEAK